MWQINYSTTTLSLVLLFQQLEGSSNSKDKYSIRLTSTTGTTTLFQATFCTREYENHLQRWECEWVWWEVWMWPWERVCECTDPPPLLRERGGLRRSRHSVTRHTQTAVTRKGILIESDRGREGFSFLEFSFHVESLCTHRLTKKKQLWPRKKGS